MIVLHGNWENATHVFNIWGECDSIQEKGLTPQHHQKQ